MIAVYLNWEGRGYTMSRLVSDLALMLRMIAEAGGVGNINIAWEDVGVILWSETQDVKPVDIPVSVPDKLDDADEFQPEISGRVSVLNMPEEQLIEQTVSEVPQGATPQDVIRACHNEGWIDDGQMAELGLTTTSESIQILADRTSTNPHIILEDIEADIRVFVNMNVQKLRVKEQAWDVGQATWDDPGDYPSAMGARPLPSHQYIEEIYGAAVLAFDIPIENIPPNIHWRIEHAEKQVRDYKLEGQHIQRVQSSTSRKSLGTLIFSDELGNEAVADIALLSDALDEELYRVKEDLDELMLPPEFNQSYSLQIQWAHWEQVENKLTCTMGVTAELD